MSQVLAECFTRAETGVDEKEAIVGSSDALRQDIARLASSKHAARGVALTLAVYKACDPDQDVRAHKSEQSGGFAARTFDAAVTVPFLIDNSLARSVETHWLTQTFSFASRFDPGTSLKTNPKWIGPALIEVVNGIQGFDREGAKAAAVIILAELIKIRNRDKVVLTRPKGQSINGLMTLLQKHINQSYTSNAPRLPQLAIYAIYQCVLPTTARYAGQELTKLERMKAADRKLGTVGDVVVTQGGLPKEAVEIKHGQPITIINVKEAIEKVRAVSVLRYYLLSSAQPFIEESQSKEIRELQAGFLKSNGCEIIVNGVFGTIQYYLRLLPDTDQFVFAYTLLLEDDVDLGYEHRNAWNELCKDL